MSKAAAKAAVSTSVRLCDWRVLNCAVSMHNSEQPLIYLKTEWEGARMEEQRIAKSHKLVVNNRKTSMVTGVLDVLSFDLNEILLETEQGMLMVKGTDLHVNRLSVEKGEVDLSGNIDSIAYSSASPAGKQAENFLSKLFK